MDTKQSITTARLRPDEIVTAIEAGATLATVMVLAYSGKSVPATIAHLVSCNLCDDGPDNALHALLRYVGAQSAAGDEQATALAERLARDIVDNHEEPPTDDNGITPLQEMTWADQRAGVA